MREVVVERLHEAVRDVADVDRLEARVRRGQRDDRQHARQPREQVEERVLAAEDHRGRKIVQRRPDAATIASAAPLVRWYCDGPAGSAPSALICSKRVTPAGVARGRRACAASSTCARSNVAAPLSFRMPTRLTTAVAPASNARQRARIVDVGLDHVDRRQQDQVLGILAPARRHDDAMPGGREARDHVAADEAAAAQDDDADGSAIGYSVSSAAELTTGPLRGATMPRRAVSGCDSVLNACA